MFVANGRKDCVFNDAAVFVCYTAKVVFLTGGRGGNGGGAIKLTAEISITVNGQIQMDGDMGQGDIDTR